MAAGRVVEYDRGDRDATAARRARGGAHARRAPHNLAATAQWVPVLGVGRGRRGRVLRAAAAACRTRVPALPRGDGRGERPDGRGGAASAHPAARAGPAGAARGGHRRARRRLRPRPGARADGAPPSRRAASPASTCRSEAIATRDAQAAAAGAAQRCASRCATWPSSARTGRFDLVTAFDAIHDQAEPAAVLAEHRARAAAGRRLPDAGHRRLGRRAHERRSTRSDRSSTRSPACTA